MQTTMSVAAAATTTKTKTMSKQDHDNGKKEIEKCVQKVNWAEEISYR